MTWRVRAGTFVAHAGALVSGVGVATFGTATFGGASILGVEDGTLHDMDRTARQTIGAITNDERDPMLR